jgi:nucleoside-diphosphate-sugar epimerase
MRLVVFGATGRTGRLLVRQALAVGHWVTAYARSPGKLAIHHTRLVIVQGELDDAEAISRAVSGSDAIISTLGPGARQIGAALSNGIGTIMHAMEDHGVQRIVMLSTVSVRDPLDMPEWRRDTLVSLIRLLFRSSYDEILRMALVLRSSPLRWTLVRVPILTNRPKRERGVSGYAGAKSLRLFISRADLAWFLLKEAEEPKFVHAAPMVSTLRG